MKTWAFVLLAQKKLLSIVFVLAILFGLADSIVAEPLSLDEAVEQGLKANSSVKIEENEFTKAELDGKIANSYYYPELSLFSSYSHLEPRPGARKEIIPGLPPLELNMGRNDVLSHGAQLRYILYEGGRRSHLKEASAQRKEASRWLLLDRRRTVEFDVRRAYLNSLLLKEMEGVAAQNLVRHQRRALDAKRAFQVGSIARLELLRAEAEEADAKITVDEAADRAQSALQQFSILINSPNQVEPLGNLRRGSDIAAQFDLSLLKEKEPEFARLMAMSFEQKAAEEAAEAKKADGLPSVVTGLKAAQTNPYLSEKKYGPDYSAFVQLTIPIFDFGRSSAIYDKSKLDAQNAVLKSDELRRTLTGQYNLLIDRIANGKRAIGNRSVSLARAKAALEAAQVAYKNGSIDLSRLLDAEILMLKSDIDFLKATAEFYENIAEWERWSGQSSGLFKIFNRSES